MRLSRLFAVSFLAVLLIASLAYAQAPPAPAQPDTSATVAAVITAVGTVAIPWVIWGVTLLLPMIPRAILPFMPVVLGFVVEKLPVWTAGLTSPISVAAIALAALILREVLNTIAQHGAAGGGGQVAPGITKVLFSK